ncbi:hypothetical protein R3P38DRAFT_3108578 [Favolaschia claudopus]|uniref:G-protein coupled receptors family 2 profile 2 domain-containing protein n=1 Tax=Favolaschia claudopus TaxID=2862362 RepID=A0AAV9ZHI0_9AGAR
MAYSEVGEFVWTPHLVNVSNQLWAITASVGAALCGTVLLVIAILALNPVSRQFLDRVSFRILVWTLFANTVFGITNAVGGKFKGPTWACAFDIFLLQLTLELSGFLLFCVALNLQLVVIHQVNCLKLEKFYVIGSIALSLALTIPPYAANQYGWDPLVEDCWYANDDPKQRLAWQIGTQLFWTLLTVTGELVTSTTVVIYMLRHRVRLSFTPVARHWTDYLQTRTRKRIQGAPPSQGRSRTESIGGPSDSVSHVNLYRNVILRIVLYPLASAVVNLTSVVCVIHATRHNGVQNWTDYRILLLSDFIYGGRAILYACLAATDPALTRAVRAWLQYHGFLSSGSSSQLAHSRIGVSTTTTNSRPNALSVHIELATVQQDDDGMIIASEHGHSSKDSSSTFAFKAPASDIEASPSLNLKELPPIPVTEGSRRISSPISVSLSDEDGARWRQQQQQRAVRDLERQREEFQRRI